MFDKSTVISGERVLASSVSADATYAHTDYIDVTGLEKITVNKQHSAATTNFYFYSDKTNTSISYYRGSTADVPTGAKYVRINFGIEDINSFMVVSGSTVPSSYIPYGSVLPVQSGGITTNVYTAEPLRKIGDYTDYKSESAEYRAIYKLVLTGQEDWTTYTDVANTYRYILPSAGVTLLGICSHFTAVTALVRLADGTFLRGGINYLYIRYDTPADVTAFKQYLTDQYNAGTPVCVWYVLATPTTTSISSPTIPMTTDANIFNVNTTLTPSKADITYHGWHPQATTGREYTEVSKSITSLPSTIHADGNSLESFKIYGNMTVNGNLYDISTNVTEQGSISGSDGTNMSSTTRIRCNTRIDIQSGTYTISANATKDLQIFVFIYNTDNTFDARIPSDWVNLPYTFNVLTNKKMRFVIKYKDNTTISTSDVSNIMLNRGPDAFPYSPYNATPSTTYPIYQLECGDRTDNKWSLFPNPASPFSGVTFQSDIEGIHLSGTGSSSNNYATEIKLPAGTYTLSANTNKIISSDSNACIQLYKANVLNALITNNNSINGTTTFTLQEDTSAIQIRIRI